MTAADHAAEAEKYLSNISPDPAHHPENMLLVPGAQVHATLAVARQLADIAALLGGIRDELKGLR